MSDFKKRLISAKRVSVWGMGYLGYTWIMRLQTKGFRSDVHDFMPERLDALMTNQYPRKSQKETWSTKGVVPPIDLSKIRLNVDIGKMFQNNLHIISFPGKNESGNGNCLVDISGIFKQYKKCLTDSLILFQSGETPGDVQRLFINPLRECGITCSIATAFRTDWSIEEFFDTKKPQVLSGCDQESQDKVRSVFDLFGIKYEMLSSVKEAEIYESSRKSLQHIVSSFFNQLMLAYPDTDIRKVSELAIDALQIEGTYPNLGVLGYKSASAIGHLLDGSTQPEKLTILRDSEAASLSALIIYSEIIRRKSDCRVMIFGISEKSDQRDIRLSPALILAESLLSKGVHVQMHDPYFDGDEIGELLPEADFLPGILEPLKCECIVMMTPHLEYHYLNQSDLDFLGITSAKIVIDNYGLWKDFRFKNDTIYHIPGDGKLRSLER